MSNSDEKPKKKTGRPSLFTQELADLICQRVASCSFGLRKLCSLHDDLPTSETVYEWRYKYPAFSSQYAEAKLRQADLMAEELLDIADSGTNDWMETLSDDEKGLGWRLNGEHVQRSRLRIDTRKWLAAKLLPKQYGAAAEPENKEKSQAETYVLRKI